MELRHFNANLRARPAYKKGVRRDKRLKEPLSVTYNGKFCEWSEEISYKQVLSQKVFVYNDHYDRKSAKSKRNHEEYKAQLEKAALEAILLSEKRQKETS